ncbi:unnamed protein product [Cylindrotheca closterium]|uniref:Uncharacterized protein n=1 Tax=Cylindrotheca closterium TaxID=2856 RepID=A0AAD2JL52_9STRA|nr:unnamed protein product [Cylindrotheca closterium]
MATILKHVLCLLILAPAVLVRAESSILLENNASSSSSRVSTTIKFEYKLDASNIPQYGSVQTVVDVIDSVMIDRMQQKLSPLEAAQLGDAVLLDQVKSEIYSQCFAKGDECVMARSMLTISHNGTKSERSLQFAALRLVQEFLKEFDTSYVDVATTYMFPRIIQTAAKFDIHGVNVHLKPNAIEIFRETMLVVYGDALTAKQGSMDLLDIQYNFQEKKQGDDDAPFLEAHLMISGTCRSCTERSFQYIFDTVFEESRDEFQNQLRLNADSKGISEFAGVTEIAYSWPEEPEFLDSLDETFFVEDVADEVTEEEIPWWIIWIGIGLLLVSLGLGILLFGMDDMRAWETSRRNNENNNNTSNNNSTSDSSTKPIDDVSDTSDENSQFTLSSRYELEEIVMGDSNPYAKHNVGSPSNSDGSTYSI